ncbi:MAG: dethiobiotin synthase [Myxococcales bacterium]|nr:dethiobiotin synthase [Myxococcales bacterium]
MTTHPILVRDRLLREEQHLQAIGRLRQLSLARAIDFTSNDYLGFSQHPEIVQAMVDAARTYGAGAPGSRLLGGHYPIHDQVEDLAAKWCNTEGALLFTSGWHANAAVLGAVVRPDDRIFSDTLNHASLIDGCRLTRARTTIFRHLDVEHLEQCLRQTPCRGFRFIVTESVYSMDGDLAPLEDYIRLAITYNAYLLVDEAHAVGLWGPEGQGRVAELPPSDRVLARTLTAGKSMGVSGALVVGDAPVINAIINGGRSFIYTTAVSPAVAAAIGQSIKLLSAYHDRAQTVFARAEQLRQQLRDHWSLTEPVLGQAAIVPVVLGSDERALRVATTLQDQGFDVRAIRPPTVPRGTSRIRVVCHADHTEDHINKLGKAIYHALLTHPKTSDTPPERPKGYTVIGTDTHVGKTVVSAVLTQYFSRTGTTQYLKPVQTGLDADTDTVAQLAALPVHQMIAPPIQFPLPASIDQAAEHAGTEVHLTELLNKVHEILKQPTDTTWVIETAGGLLVPLNSSEDQSQLVKQLGFPTILVARSGLGTLNHTFLTLEAAERRGITVKGVIVVGPYHAANLNTFTRQRSDLRWLSLPEFSSVTAQAITQWLDETGATLLDTWFS